MLLQFGDGNTLFTLVAIFQFPESSQTCLDAYESIHSVCWNFNSYGQSQGIGFKPFAVVPVRSCLLKRSQQVVTY